MSYHLSKTSVEAAVRHICRYGDTDIFPNIPELAFFVDKLREVTEELILIDLDIFNPSGAIEALAPKSRYGFRIAHQLAPLDNILILACTIEFGEKIETRRIPPQTFASFSYRFKPDGMDQIFDPSHTYKDWLIAQKSYIEANPGVSLIICIDISDFYARINFHRLDNLLDQAGRGHGAARYLKKQIKTIRAKQSFGLPVGGAAARLIAELALTDTDRALLDQGIVASRFVDDFRIYLTAQENPYDALGFLAEQLGINEGLSLNVAKTSVLSRSEYISLLDRMTTEVMEEADGVALEALTANIYSDEHPDPADIAKLRHVNLIGFIEEEIEKEHWDMGQIKVLFRALRITKSNEAIGYIIENFSRLIVFAKELCLLMEVLEADNWACFDDLGDELIVAILKPPASSVQVIRTWLLEIFVRGVVSLPLDKLRNLENLPSPLDKRQLLLLRGRCDDVNYFRRQKTAIDHFSAFEQPCLVWGASCLPDDEYETWLGTIKPIFQRPLGELFLKWAKQNKDKLQSRLSAARDEHPD